MEFRNTTIIGVSLPDRSSQGGGGHLYAEIIIIERGYHQLRPLLYQLKRESTPYALSQQVDGLVHLPEGAFMMVGEVAAIDKMKKIIHLTNGSTVSYKYLVVTSEMNKPSLGAQDHDTCSQALETLIEALNIHHSLPEGIKTHFTQFYHGHLKNDFKHKILTEQDKAAWNEICKIATGKMSHQLPEQDSAFYKETNRLSELQL